MNSVLSSRHDTVPGLEKAKTNRIVVLTQVSFDRIIFIDKKLLITTNTLTMKYSYFNILVVFWYFEIVAQRSYF